MGSFCTVLKPFTLNRAASVCCASRLRLPNGEVGGGAASLQAGSHWSGPILSWEFILVRLSLVIGFGSSP